MPYAFEGHEGTSFPEGRQTLTGGQSLEFSRTRKTLAHGDFDRSMNQGRVLLAALAQFKVEFRRISTALFKWIAVGMRNVATDVPLNELLTLAFASSEFGPKRITNLVAVGSIGTAGGASIVNLPSARTPCSRTWPPTASCCPRTSRPRTRPPDSPWRRSRPRPGPLAGRS